MQHTEQGVLLADDFPPFRQNLAGRLAEHPHLFVAGEASNGREAVELARSLRPAIIVMDYRMPELDGVAACTRILEDNPNIFIILTSLSFERQYVLRALAAGAQGYMAKDDALDSLGSAIDAVHAQRRYLSPSVAALIERTAPPNLLQVSQQVLRTFDHESPALLACARRIAEPAAADAAVLAAFRAYWITLRESNPVSDPQTWLLLSLAASLFPARAAAPERWSLTHAHPRDSDLRPGSFAGPRLLNHVSACRPCHLAWTLGSHKPGSIADPAILRSSLIRDLQAPNESELFLTYTQRQAGVVRLAASELNLVLGSEAGKGWMHREASAGSWLGALLGGRPVQSARP
ncbi:MAG: response regulator transcription factor [Bryobacteraceae bacterium]